MFLYWKLNADRIMDCTISLLIPFYISDELAYCTQSVDGFYADRQNFGTIEFWHVAQVIVFQYKNANIGQSLSFENFYYSTL